MLGRCSWVRENPVFTSPGTPGEVAVSAAGEGFLLPASREGSYAIAAGTALALVPAYGI